MKIARLLPLIYFALVGCASPGDRWTLLREQSLKAGTCAVHSVKLETFTYYGNDKVCVLPDYDQVMKLYDRYPNAAQWGVFPKKTEIFYQAEAIVACPECIKAFDASE